MPRNCPAHPCLRNCLNLTPHCPPKCLNQSRVATAQDPAHAPKRVQEATQASSTTQADDEGRGEKRARVTTSIATPTAPAIEAVNPPVIPSPAQVPVATPLPQTPARTSTASSNPYSALRSVGATAAASSSPSPAQYPYPYYPSTPVQIRYGTYTHPWPLEPRFTPQPGLVVASVWCGEAYGYALRWVPPPQAPGASQVPAPGPART
ncbi:hypothetical protein DFP72DRAFT_851881 [Ephemerocybe angulata]|uniref:Uncharacterized protein n=1 Tax=Ephemerocybe angulata TaxID=980116 RepID=A0A8H6HPB9_9AGAR|nr:hypothetical protein DFP72DRAFT_851881 [Tulosesus angulatus]